jgi:hypothetical protein
MTQYKFSHQKYHSLLWRLSKITPRKDLKIQKTINRLNYIFSLKKMILLPNNAFNATLISFWKPNFKLLFAENALKTFRLKSGSTSIVRKQQKKLSLKKLQKNVQYSQITINIINP